MPAKHCQGSVVQSKYGFEHLKTVANDNLTGLAKMIMKKSIKLRNRGRREKKSLR